LWNVDLSSGSLKPTDVFTSSSSFSHSNIRDFVHVIDNQAELYHGAKSVAPMDFGIVVAWRSLVTALLPKEIDGDLLKLVHLSNEFRVLSSNVITADDKIDTEAIINSVSISSIGKVRNFFLDLFMFITYFFVFIRLSR
jgi:hypothetical protein